MKPAAGDVAPDFTAMAVDAAGERMVTLSELRGRTVVLVFYPKDNTPGCTQQACAMRDGWADLKDRALIFGVSVDSAASHRKFVAKKELPYPLLVDEDRKIVEAYGVWGEKSFMGRKFMGTERTTFVIGADGRIAAVLEKVQAGKHLDLLTAALA